MSDTSNIAVKAIVLNEHGELLILKRASAEDVDAELWDLPGGRLSVGEIKEQGLLREAKEETGLDIEIVTPANIWSYSPNAHTTIKGYTYLCKYIGGDVALSAEHSEYKWIVPDDLGAYEAHPNLQAEIRKIFHLNSLK